MYNFQDLFEHVFSRGPHFSSSSGGWAAPAPVVFPLPNHCSWTTNYRNTQPVFTSFGEGADDAAGDNGGAPPAAPAGAPGAAEDTAAAVAPAAAKEPPLPKHAKTPGEQNFPFDPNMPGAKEGTQAEQKIKEAADAGKLDNSFDPQKLKRLQKAESPMLKDFYQALMSQDQNGLARNLIRTADETDPQDLVDFLSSAKVERTRRTCWTFSGVVLQGFFPAMCKSLIRVPRFFYCPDSFVRRKVGTCRMYRRQLSMQWRRRGSGEG